MKRAASVVLFIVILIVLNYGCIEFADRYYDKKVKDGYCDSAGDLCDTDKNQGMILQEISVDKKDNLIIFGSSELGTQFISQHPSNLFKDKKDGFQINLIGRGYCQSFIQNMDILSMANHFKDKKVVFILSPQWFNSSGLTSNTFNMNFSNVQFYSIMFNKDIDKRTKLKVALRVRELLTGTKNITWIGYTALYIQETNVGQIALLL